MKCCWQLLRMAFVRAGFTPVHLRMMFFGFFYSVLTIGKPAQVCSVLCRRKVLAAFVMYFVVAVALSIVVNIILFHIDKI